MISIIIPHHNEDKEVIRPLMNSINSQIGIDFNKIELLLCSDVDESPLDNYDFAEYENLVSRIRKIKSPYKNNPGLSRQAGLDNAIGDYVVFCDADDALYHLGALRELSENIERTNADIYRFNFIEEVGSRETKRRDYLLKRFNWTWVFAKAYKIEFLRVNNIRFSTELLYHEDSYFNYIARFKDPKFVDVDSSPFYLWKYSDTSITRKDDHAYSFISWDEYITAISLAMRKVIREYHKTCDSDILSLSVQSYVMLTNSDYDRFRGGEYDRVEKRYYDFLKEFFPAAFQDEIPNIKRNIAQLFFDQKPGFIPEISWHKHVKLLKEKYE